MGNFPTIDPTGRTTDVIGRSSQRDILPTAVRRRHQLFEEKSISIIISPPGGEGDFYDIQKAINELNNVGGGIAYLKTGTYTVTSDIRLYENITLIGTGSETTIIDFNNADYGFFVEASSDKTANIHLEGLKIINSYNYTNGAIFFDQCKDCSIKNCYFQKNKDPSESDGKDIFIKGSERILITGCESTYSHRLVTGDTSDENENIHIIDNYCFMNNGGFVKTPGSYSVISGNYSGNSTAILIELSTSGTGAHINNNTLFYSSADAINVNSSGVTIANNIIDSSTGAGSGVETGATGDQTVIVGNNFSAIAASSSGVNIATNCDGVIISGNSFTGGADTIGITVVDNTCDQTVIVGNFFNVATDIDDSGTNTIAEHNGTL